MDKDSTTLEKGKRCCCDERPPPKYKGGEMLQRKK
jgi:hypothetical protein